jgi:hypothetical protein
MRRLLVVVALCSCAARASEPAWPHDRPTAADGGESLAPHVRKQVPSVALERADDTKPVVVRQVAPTPVTSTAARETPAPAVTPSVVQPTEEVITTEDIVIDIDD